ncbi:hypothetical protein CWE11_09175 [Aliidiomarina sanyensis]|uniref:Uncharacterized protein n=1 Tax=Aliidiomarina sanyensis TaxID=1249555 RepID=A0A432WDP0_9GAMM|nr:hypothetical protein CWE11_09175 [Aliidiomarina sanyensis]
MGHVVLVFFLLSLVFAVFFYIQAWKFGMGRRRWAFFGLLLGPFLFPMFRTHQRMLIMKARGFHGTYFSA